MTTMNKRIKRTAVSRWMAMTAAALTLGACSQDETAGGDGALSPMELTATGLESMVTPMTRATVDGNWDGVTKVAVKVGSEVKLYTVTADDADKKEATLKAGEGVVPFYWPASGSETVSAWWPYNGADITTKPAVVVKSDQSGVGYAASDFIEAVDQRVTEGYPKLVFEHRTAKICVTLKAADGTTPLTGAVVSIVVGGQTVVEKCYNENSSNEYLALIAPTAAEEELTVKIAADSKNYVYKHTTAVEYEANSQYTFNLKLKGDEVVALSGCTITEWTPTTLVSDGTAEEDPGYTKLPDGTYYVTSAAGLKAWAEAIEKSADKDVSCVLKNDIEMPALGAGESSNWEPISQFRGIFDGNGKTITGLVVNKTGSVAGFIANNYGMVKNLTLKDAKITGGNNVGAVVSHNSRAIENCHVTGKSVITGSDSFVGGVAGINDPNGTILACHVAKDCKVIGTQMRVGGIAGENNGHITGCYALCSLKGFDGIGGICGQNNKGLTACYSKCEFEAMSQNPAIGGIAGDASGIAAFFACYWKEAENCSKGVGNGAADPSGVTQITADNTWTRVCNYMNTELVNTIYEFYANPTTETSADEPLMLRRKQ